MLLSVGMTGTVLNGDWCETKLYQTVIQVLLYRCISHINLTVTRYSLPFSTDLVPRARGPRGPHIDQALARHQPSAIGVVNFQMETAAWQSYNKQTR